MPDTKSPASVVAAAVPARLKKTNYPEPFATRMARREKRVLGDLFGLKNFGVNLTRLAPGGESALLHCHGRQDEFIYVIDGTATLVTDAGEMPLSAGMCAGFAAGGTAHHIVNR
ncbi:MAG TPA: cupin domain-containing protein, partial [Vineibacter sp.]|nr:cupin domain-containing protein [Vineibacter sp.]